jgi:hypothetical protein
MYLAVCLGRVGRDSEALAAGTEAVRSYRQLAASDPAGYRPDLDIYTGLAAEAPRAFNADLRATRSLRAEILRATGKDRAPRRSGR